MVARDLGASDVRIAPAIRGRGRGCAQGGRGDPLVRAAGRPPPDRRVRRGRRPTPRRGAGAWRCSSPPSRARFERRTRCPSAAKGRGHARSLREELDALAQRAGAVEAVVIDAHSPVIWGSAGGDVERPAGAVHGARRDPRAGRDGRAPRGRPGRRRGRQVRAGLRARPPRRPCRAPARTARRLRAAPGPADRPRGQHARRRHGRPQRRGRPLRHGHRDGPRDRAGVRGGSTAAFSSTSTTRATRAATRR